jgi:hypothetical protein
LNLDKTGHLGTLVSGEQFQLEFSGNIEAHLIIAALEFVNGNRRGQTEGATNKPEMG